MKVTAKQNPTTIRFKDVDLGQVFVYDDEIYMKLAMDYHAYDEVFRAVHLETGELCPFDNFDEVELPIKIVHMEVTY